jgi:hypothetical protein
MTDKLTKAIQDMLRREIEKAFFGGIQTSTTATTESVLDVRKFVSDMNKMLRNFRRTQITFIVDRAHQGPPVRHQTPNDGERIELSWMEANRVHREWPLKLYKVVSEDAAEFVPCTVGEFVPKILEQPPYDVPPEENFEDWLKGGDTPPRS